jgi:hypothetical protein
MDAPHAEIESRVLSCIKPQFRAPVSSFALRPCHICTGTGLTPATSAPGLGSPLPHLHRDRANPCHICTETALAPATSAPGLGEPLPLLCTGTGRPGTCTRTPRPLVPVLHTVLCFADCLLPRQRNQREPTYFSRGSSERGLDVPRRAGGFAASWELRWGAAAEKASNTTYAYTVCVCVRVYCMAVSAPAHQPAIGPLLSTQDRSPVGHRVHEDWNRSRASLSASRRARRRCRWAVGPRTFTATSVRWVTTTAYLIRSGLTCLSRVSKLQCVSMHVRVGARVSACVRVCFDACACTSIGCVL